MRDIKDMFRRMRCDAYWNALSMIPPPHPLLPYLAEQSMSCCSDRDRRDPVAWKNAASVAPTALKAQQPPHDPWFFTGVTAPLSRLFHTRLLVCLTSISLIIQTCLR